MCSLKTLRWILSRTRGSPTRLTFPTRLSSLPLYHLIFPTILSILPILVPLKSFGITSACSSPILGTKTTRDIEPINGTKWTRRSAGSNWSFEVKTFPDPLSFGNGIKCMNESTLLFSSPIFLYIRQAIWHRANASTKELCHLARNILVDCGFPIPNLYIPRACRLLLLCEIAFYVPKRKKQEGR